MTEANTMEFSAMQTLIRLVSAGAQGKSIGKLRVDWASVLPLAAEQKVLSLVACALLYSPELECSDDLREYLLNVMRTESSVNLIRRQRIVHLLQEMNAAGIEAKVLKGYAVAGCYVHPECRGSADTDLLIDVCQEAQAVRFFEAHDFRVNSRAATSHHTVCQHKKYGVVELHVALYDEIIQEVWFQMLDTKELVQESSVVIEDTCGSICTLGHTDQLIFLALHMVKHFIMGGLTLRMMLDIALYFAKYRKKIDAVRFWAEMKKLHYEKLVGGILWNMIRAGGFVVSDFSDLPKEQPEQQMLLLQDLEQGGYMGIKEENERLESGMEYNRRLMRKKHSELQYRLYMLAWKFRSAAKYMFPSAKVLRRLYPITKRGPVLMPFLWVWQSIAYPIKKICAGSLKRDVRSEHSTMTRVSERRIAMFKALGMLE